VTVLLLGGTAEARELAARLVRASTRVVSSLAGRVADPLLPDGEVRIGGFGGAEGLTAWLRAHAPVAVVDATHPFAEQISRHAVTATAATGTPLLRLERPGWTAEPGDRWHRVADLAAAAALLPTVGTRPLLTLGRGDLTAFICDPACAALDLLVRCVDPPNGPLPPRTHVLLARGPFDLPGEVAVLRAHRADVLVTRDSGGTATAAKLHAARTLAIPVLVIDRPPPPAAEAVGTVSQAQAWLQTHS